MFGLKREFALRNEDNLEQPLHNKENSSVVPRDKSNGVRFIIRLEEITVRFLAVGLFITNPFFSTFPITRISRNGKGTWEQ